MYYVLLNVMQATSSYKGKTPLYNVHFLLSLTTADDTGTLKAFYFTRYNFVNK